MWRLFVCVCLFLFLEWMRTTILSLMEWTSRTPFSLTLQRCTVCLPAFSSFPTARLALSYTTTPRSGRLRRIAGYVAHQNQHHKTSFLLLVVLREHDMPFSHSVIEKDIYFYSVAALLCFHGGHTNLETWKKEWSKYCGAHIKDLILHSVVFRGILRRHWQVKYVLNASETKRTFPEVFATDRTSYV